MKLDCYGLTDLAAFAKEILRDTVVDVDSYTEDQMTTVEGQCLKELVRVLLKSEVNEI